MFRLTIFILSFFLITYLNAAIVHVSETGSGSFNGSSWANAISGNNLQSTIDAAAIGDSIWVACGTYYASNTNDRSAAFNMRNGISIFGSFQGTELSFDERQFTCGPCSVLSGDLGTANFSNDNTYTVIVNNGLDNSALIDGFEVSDGYDNRSVSSIENGLGGGIYNGGHGNNGSCSPTFRNMLIVNNFATYGAGMFNNGFGGGNSAPILINCIIAFNTATVGGGGMDSYGWNNGNVAPTLVNCLMYGNHSDDRAGAMYCWGGLNGNCSPNIINSAFINNTADNIAGGIIVDNSNNLAGTAPYSGVAEINISNSILWGNTAMAGPQFYILGNGNFNATYSNIDTIGQSNAHPIAGSSIGNLFLDPFFTQIGNGIGIDNCWMTADDGTTLTIESPNINAGRGSNNSADDLSNRSRISGESIDIGPYEYQLLQSVVWTGAEDASWDTNNNWFPERMPDATQDVIIPENLTTYPVLNHPTSIRSLLLEVNSQLEIMEEGSLRLSSNQ